MPASSALCALFAPGCDESSNSCGASLRPRLGTSSSSVPLPCVGSAGRRITTSAVASTLAVRVARRLREIGDDGVAIVGRIEGDGGARGDPLIGADVTKASAGEGRQAFHDIEANDLRPQRNR